MRVDGDELCRTGLGWERTAEMEWKGSSVVGVGFFYEPGAGGRRRK